MDAFGLVGNTLDGRYRVDHAVAEGGFGVLYRGWHLGFEHAVAIKCLKLPAHFTAAAQAVFFDKFREEGKFLSRLGEHPSIVRVFDIATTTTPAGASVPYLVLEWLEGEDLAAIMKAGARPFGDERAVLSLLRPAVDAMAFAHANGIAHRDIKPANLFLARTQRGTVLKVLDFGIGKAMQEGETAAQEVTHTSSGFSAFTAKYGAPEQLRPKRYGPTGPWTDVHALGLLFTELVSGRDAYQGEEHGDYLLAILEAERPTPRARGASVSDAFEALCARCLASSPAERFHDAAELGAAMDAIEVGAPIVFPDSDQCPPSLPPMADPSTDTGAFLAGLGPDALVTRPEATSAATPEPASSWRTTVEPPVLAPVLATPVPVALPAAPRARARWRVPAIAAAVCVPLAGVAAWRLTLDSGAAPPRAASASAAPSARAPAPSTVAPSVQPAATSPCPAGMVQAPGGAVGTTAIAPFCLDRLEVTTADYTACVVKGTCDKRELTCGAAANFGVAGRERHPINCVNAAQATKYCESTGRRLPTSKEWQWAARSGEAGWVYPWGNSAAYDYSACWSGGGGAKRGTTCVGGEFPQGANAWGVLDLVGNVHEWTSSINDGSTLFCGNAYPHTDAKAFRSSAGCFTFPRDGGKLHHATDIGFRCALTLPAAP